MSERLHVRSVVLCEEIRREDNGKLFLIGVYGRDIRVAEYPANLVLSLMVSIFADTAGDAPFEMEWIANDATVANFQGIAQINRPGLALLNVTRVPILELPNDTELKIRLKIDSDDWKVLYSIPIINRVSAPPPPS